MFEDLDTERLSLRALRESDRRAMVELDTDARTNLFNPHPPSPGEADEKFGKWLRHWSDHGYGYVAITETGSDEIIGIGGVQTRELQGEKVLNLYYRFRPEAWGKGYATEMAMAVVAWAERELSTLPVVISVNVANGRSLRVAERLGFRKYVEEPYQGALSRHFRR
jgi:RimJ/RimL family protein N-acetyltransferase